MKLLARLLPRTAATLDAAREAFPASDVWAAVDRIDAYAAALPSLAEVAATVREDLRDAVSPRPAEAPPAPVNRRRNRRFVMRSRAAEKSRERGVA